MNLVNWQGSLDCAACVYDNTAIERGSDLYVAKFRKRHKPRN